MSTAGTRTAEVIIAAGGLGTRVRGWSRILPKEFYPVNGRPGIIHLLNEIAALGPARTVIVHHPYYTPFVAWARQALNPTGQRRYQQAAGLPDEPTIAPAPELTWIEQQGPYADLTSVLNGARHLRGESFYVVFADNLYPDAEPLAALHTAGEQVAVLARPYHRVEAPHRGVIVARRSSGIALMVDLIEKPSTGQAMHLEDRHGPQCLFLLEGRFRLTTTFTQFASSHARQRDEPKLSLTLRDFAQHHPVEIIPTDSTVIDLGATGTADEPTSLADLALVRSLLHDPQSAMSSAKSGTGRS